MKLILLIVILFVLSYLQYKLGTSIHKDMHKRENEKTKSRE